MCGINGLIVRDNSLDGKSAIKIMNQVIEHRGPDGDGIYTDKDVYLGHRRLSIIDLSDNAAQPMEWGKNCIVYNGEIYNYVELQKELINKDHRFTSTSDTEVLLHGLAIMGIQFLEYLNGMYAFGFYNRETRKIIISIDDFGIKPIYYYKSNEYFAFSSELNAILSLPGIKFEINDPSIVNYLHYGYIPGPESAIKNIYKLTPREYIRFDVKSFEMELVRKPSFRRLIIPNNKIENDKKSLKNTINAVVRSHLVSDVPVGLFLSGGLDSSIICAIASKLYPQKLKTFSISYPNGAPAFDESKYSRKVAKLFNTEHFEIPFHMERFEISSSKALSFVSEPNADPTLILNYYLSEFASKHVKVVLSGLGADELFGGYNRYRAFLLAKMMKKYEGIIGGTFQYFIGNIDKNRNSLIANYIRGFDKIINSFNKENPYHSMIDYFPPDDWYIPEGDFSNYSFNNLEDIMNFDFNNYMVNNLLYISDYMSMKSSLEIRVPFVSKEMYEYALTINKKSNINIFQSKIMLKKFAESLLSKNIIYRRKQGFSAPVGTLMEYIGLDKVKELIFYTPIISDMGLNLNKLFQDSKKKEVDNSLQLYTLYVLSKWYYSIIKVL